MPTVILYCSLGVSVAGVRSKLGLDVAEDLSEEQIPLVKAYLNFQNMVGEAELLVFETGTAYTQVVIGDAIEALAALELLPTMQVRVAKSETSGTNAFARQDVDWAALANQLQTYVNEATLLTIAGATLNGGDLFVLASPATDLFPGA